MSGSDLLALVLSVIVGYLLGAIPSGVLVGRLRGVDPRSGGSGRTGTTNALRTLGPAAAVAVLVLDVVKGVAAVVVGAWFGASLGSSETWSAALAGVAAVAGHVRSVFIGFGGGRGVATGGGALALLAPVAVAVALVVMVAAVAATRYVSLGSLAAASTASVVTAVLYAMGSVELPVLVAALLIDGIVTVAHLDNIRRLAAGTERRLGRG